jgi:putative membrane protein
MEAEFFGERARREVALAVRDVEAQTAAEIVVAVRHASARYRHVDYLVGSLLAFGVLLILLFHPHRFAVSTMPLDVAVMFGLGFAVSARSPHFKRLLSSPRLRGEEVRRAARAAFVELGVSRTRGRTGVLVYVSMLERAVEVVGDSGVDECARGAPFSAAASALSRSLPDLDAFVTALRGLGAPLAQSLPHSDDDVNELPDELTTD